MQLNLGKSDRQAVGRARAASTIAKTHTLRAFLFGSAAALLLLCGSVATAQTFRGTVLGTVTDASGAVVNGAKVTVRNTDTGLTREVTTGDDGNYSAPELPVGDYSVTVEKTGFRAGVVSGIHLEASSQRRADVSLELGEISEKVEVSGDSLPQIETESDTIGGTLTSSDIGNLPVNGRDYTKLIYLNPGIAGSPDQITDSPGSFGVFSVNGARGRSNNFLLDGTDMNDGYHNIPALNQGGVFAVPSAILPVDAIAELRVLSNYEAEYGRNAGGIILFITKSGTNAFHGAALEYFRNNALDARNFFDPAGPGGQPKAPFHNNQYGGSFGGPIVRDKTFFYVDYEGQREAGGSVSIDSVPSSGSGPGGSLTQADATNPIIAKLLSAAVTAQRGAPLWPAPNFVNPSGNAVVITPFYNRVDSMIAKLDHTINTNNIISGRYFYSNSEQSFPLALSPTGGQLPGGNTVTPTVVHLVSLSLVSTLSSTKVNEARFGWNRFYEAFLPADQNFHPDTIGLCMAVTGTACPTSGPADSGLPVITVGNAVTGTSSGVFAKLGATASDTRHRVDTNWQALDNFGWKVGRHDFKVGYEYRRTTISTIVDSNARGRLNFDNVTDFLAGIPSPNSTSGSIGNLLLGDNRDRNTFQNSHGLFLEDTFRATSRLTFNAGLRWDFSGVIGEKKNLGSECVVTAGPTCTLTQLGTGGLSSGLYNPDYKNFAPRLSIAYEAFGSGKTVIRAGWGLFYDSLYQSYFMTNSVNNSSYAYGPFLNPFGPAAVSLVTSPPVTPPPGCPAGTLKAGCPIFGAPGAPQGDITTVDRNLRTPYMYNFNLNIEQQLANKIVLQVGYVGSQGHRLLRFRDIDQPSQSAITASDNACAPPGTPRIVTPGCVNSVPSAFTVLPASNTNVFYINQDESSASSYYHSLQTSLRVNGWHGFTTAANFVWSRSIDTASDGADFIPNAAQPNDSTRPNLEKGNSNFDIRRRFTWNYVYQFPNRKGSWSKLTDGWGLDGVLNLQDGQPFHLNFNFVDNYSGGGEFFDRPDVVAPIRINSHDPANFLDLTSFAIPCTLSGGNAAGNCQVGTRHFGNMGRDSLRGPSLKQLDFSLFKDTKLGERVTMQLRAEFFNILNHPNFSNPLLPSGIADAGINGSSDGTAGFCGGTATVPLGRSCGFLPITTTADVGPGNPFLGGGGPRGIQLAAKFSF
jgi:outer membrane receptor protein involved in Fe transport